MASKNKFNTAYFMFGRFNPPTTGHGAIFQKLSEEADKKADAFVFVSSTQNSNNPLPVGRKIEYINKLYGGLGIEFVNTAEHSCTQIPRAIEYLEHRGYTHMTMYVGSDYTPTSFEWLTKKYPNVTIKIIDRPVNNSGNSVSATRVRAAARNGNVSIVKKLTGLSEENADQLIEDIKRENAQRVHHTYRKAPKSRAKSKPYSRSPKKGGYYTRKLKK